MNATTVRESPVYADAALTELLEAVWNCERKARRQVSWTFASEGSKS